MLLEKVYTDFVAHTSLTDSIYKSVFVNISEILDKICNIDLISLAYIDPDDGKTFFDLNKNDGIQRYAVELFQNIFKNYYTLPNSASIELHISYKDVEYKIISTGIETSIPEEIKFLEKLELSDWFVLDKPIVDLFGEFDKIFKFVNSFKTPINSIFEPLKKKLEKTEAVAHVLDNNISKNSIAETELAIENLQKKIKDILANIDELRQKRDHLQVSKNNLFKKINSREVLLSEQEKIKIEYETLKETQKEYIKKRDYVSTIVKEIEAVLSDLNEAKKQGEVSEKDINLYIEKKIKFEKDIESRNASIKDFNDLLTNMSDKLKAISNDLLEIENYTTNDIETLEANIRSTDTEQENLYSILLGLEGELKHQKSLLNSNAPKMERSLSGSKYSDIAIQNVETAAITNHLTTTLQPTSVTAVINYLRYYFAYYATIITKDFLNHYEGLDTYLAQAVAAKVVLLRHFGIYFNKIFSAIDFADNRIGKVINITQD